VARASYYGAEQDPNAYGIYQGADLFGGFPLQPEQRLVFVGSSSTVFGIDNTNDRLKDVKLGAGGEANTTLADQTVNTLGTFVQHDWKSNKVNLSLGLRYDYIVSKIRKA
jgi:outer membrane receptor for ferrienterochelin and colicins